MDNMSLSLNNILSHTILASVAVAGGCQLINSPRLEKVKNLAMAIGIGAAAIYGYVNTPNTPSPAAAPRAQIAHRPEPRDEIVIGTKTQFNFQNGEAACTVMAAQALVSMLKGSQETSTSIDQILSQGASRYTAISRELGAFKEAGNVSLSWDQAYNSSRLSDFGSDHSGFQKELISECDNSGTPKEIAIPLSKSETASIKAYQTAFDLLANKVTAPGQSQGGILIMSPETHSVCISRSETGQLRYQLFDSHGSFFVNNAAIFEFGNSIALAKFLHDKKGFIKGASVDFNKCGLYPCKLR